jgi:predicted dehydrogenase
MEQTRIGFIGAGGIAHRHFDVLCGFADVQLVAFSDPAQDRAHELARRCEGRAYSDYRAMLDAEKLDAVYICVPPFAHGDLELTLIERGLPFFVEKPLAADLPTAEHVAAAVEARNLVTAVGYHWRYMDTTDEAQQLLSNNPARLALGYWLDSTPPPAWWGREEQSGGQMVEQTTHLFDLARVLVGEVDRVFAIGSTTPRERFPDLNVFDVTTASLQFRSGAVGSLSSTCLLDWKHRVGLHLFSDGMVIELSEHDIMIDVGRGRPVRGQQGDPVAREDRDFIDAVQGRENRIRAPYAEALRTHRLTIAANQSAHAGIPVELEAVHG